MGSDGGSNFLIACRYVPYDQWFLTNISPSWKIKHLKQTIIAKALNLPFDRRLLIQDRSPSQTPSPITFAPIEGTHRESGSSLRSDDVEDPIQEDIRPHGQGSEGGTKSFADTYPTSQLDPNRPSPIVEVSVSEDKDQIYTSIFTLIRFSTGQILEDNFCVPWYNLVPHELVELHCSSPPITFARALVFEHLLTNEGSITVDVPFSCISDPHTGFNSNSDRLPLSSLPPRTATLSLALADSPSLTSLPRHDLESYIEPYWEGWVRVLRVVWRPAVDCSQTGGLPTSGSGFTFSSEKRVKEWSEKWAVIKNGVLRLCRRREDSVYTQLPLSALISLCGAEYFSFSHSGNDQGSMTFSAVSPAGDKFKRRSSSYSNLAPTVRARRSASVSDPSRTTHVEIEGAGDAKFLLTATSSNSPTAPRVLSPLMTQMSPTRVAANINPPSATTPTDSALSSTHFPIDPARSRRERAAIRELEHERMQKEMVKKAPLDKQVEYIKRWDDLGLVFGGKSKERGKEMDKEREKKGGGRRGGKDREEKPQKTKQSAAAGSSHHPFIGEVEMDKGRNHGRYEKDRQRGTSQRHHRDRFFHPDDRYIPASLEEAIAKGMMIVCAKFRTSNLDYMDRARNNDKGYTQGSSRDTGLDPSVARKEGEESESQDGWTQEDKRRRARDAECQRSQTVEGSPVMTPLSPPRKASLPGLGLTLLSSGGNITPSGIFGGIFGNKDKDSDSTETSDRGDGLDVINEKAKSKQHGPDVLLYRLRKLTNLTGNPDDRHAALLIKSQEVNDQRFNLSVNTENSSPRTALSSSYYYVNDSRLEDQNAARDDRTEYSRAEFEYGDKVTDQRANREEQKRRKKTDDRLEWVVLDVGTEVAYNSFLRILHRHFPPPIHSSFVHTTASPFQPPPLYPSLDNAPQRDDADVTLALPYPEWRRDVVFRARSQGLRESGRPLELALYNCGTTLPRERRKRKSQIEQGSLIASERRKDHTSEIDGSDDDFADHDTFDMGLLVMGDSDAESEDESLRWWQDIPRQLAEKWAPTEHGNVWSWAEENPQEYSPSSPNMSFTDPFSFSPNSSEANPRSPVSEPNIKERLRSSISSSTLASNNTSSSASGFPFHNSPDSYQFGSYPRRIISPSQTLSSPSSNESLGSHPYHRFLPRPFSPSSDVQLSNTVRQAPSSPSVLHHAASMPNTSIVRSLPPSGGTVQRDPTREGAVPVPSFYSKPILTTAQNQRVETEMGVQLSSKPAHDLQSNDDFTPNIDANRRILTLAQIHQIEEETEAMIGGDHIRLTHDAAADRTTRHKMPTAVYNKSVPTSNLQQESLENRYGEVREEDTLERDSEEQPRDGLLVRDNIITRSMASLGAPSSFRDQDYMSDGPPRLMSDFASSSVSAKAILRRVRSGSSLQMEVHFEEYEEDGGN